MQKSEIVSQIAGLTFFNYKCHLCELQLTSNSDMRSHFQAKHEPVTVVSENGALVHACKQCGARFSQYSSAIKHCRKRKEKPPTTCPKCDKVIYCKNLKRHIQTIHTRPERKSYFCPKCKRMLKVDESKFKMHYDECRPRTQVSHQKKLPSSNEEATWFKCSICGYTSVYEVALKKHMTTKHVKY